MNGNWPAYDCNQEGIRMERTFLMVKPDGVQRGLIGEIVARFEKKGLQLAGAKFMRVSKELAEQHYYEHKGKPFYEPLLAFITAGPVFAMVWEGDNVIALTRALIGKTDAAELRRAPSAPIMPYIRT
ncbi:hypothetical protein BN871_BX_00770 [Paenibacillus sp. P22]|nr:hypothetical protein BN871_BX_00770 [Paenibacillus sp. P22]